MSSLLTRRLAHLSHSDLVHLLNQCSRGIEREALRVDAQGRLAMTPHPATLGSALTHPKITTDYAEALIELITAPASDASVVLNELETLHRFVHHELGQRGDEILWSHSMPCRLPKDEEIPIAWYGESHAGMLKHVYRRGLALRYGKSMQCISGIHYNFSLPEEIWCALQSEECGEGSAMDWQSEGYIALIRNFRRYCWLLMYLFGASPALLRSFAGKREFPMEAQSDDTLYLPFATSLRMSDMGYQNDAQAGLTPDYNTLESYICSLVAAMSQPHWPYVQHGTQHDGRWLQLNTNRLQIENEYYSAIRPKRVTRPGERPLAALAQRGVQYIEVRCLDVDPFEPLGIGIDTCRFLDVFLLFCALSESPPTERDECRQNTVNFSQTVKEGRRPGMTLMRDGALVSLRDWGLALLDEMQCIAELLDVQRGGDTPHGRTLAAQKAKLMDVDQTPSARVMAALKQHGQSFAAFAVSQSAAHARHFRSTPLSAAELALFQQEAQASHAEQQRLERTQTGDFEHFVQAYQEAVVSPLTMSGGQPGSGLYADWQPGSAATGQSSMHPS